MTRKPSKEITEIADADLAEAEGGAMHWGPSNNRLGGATVKPEFEVAPTPTLDDKPWAEAGHGRDTLIFPKK